MRLTDDQQANLRERVRQRDEYDEIGWDEVERLLAEVDALRAERDAHFREVYPMLSARLDAAVARTEQAEAAVKRVEALCDRYVDPWAKAMGDGRLVTIGQVRRALFGEER